MTFKDAFEKAGIKTSSTENYRKRKSHKEKNKSEKFQETRIFCEVCEATHQDVEKYKHRMPLIEAEWICSNCADKNSILDECRVTQQSHASKNGTFRRFYGAMKDFSKDGTPKENKRPHNKGNGNKKRSEKKRNYTIDEDGEKNFNC